MNKRNETNTLIYYCIILGASLAVELVNKDKSTLADYNLTLIIEDTKCDYDLAMSEFISLTQRSPPIAAILGTI